MNLINKLIDIIYPPRCPVCDAFLLDEYEEKETGCICHSCLSDLREITSPLCPICCTPFSFSPEGDHLCEDCLRKRPIYEAAYAPYLYEGGLMDAIHRFKYGQRRVLASVLGPLLAESVDTWFGQWENLLTMPVPLHPRRLRERGFNQSLLLARHVAEQLDTELDFLSLKRIRYTSPQTALKKEARRKNVRGAFEVADPGVVEERVVLLVDDVATTGNTLNECARVLKKAGCEKVFGLVLARTGH